MGTPQDQAAYVAALVEATGGDLGMPWHEAHSRLGDPASPGQARPRRDTERTITVTCSVHGAEGFCNLRITRAGGEIVLDPHVAGCCVIRLDETAATAVFGVLGEWRG